MLEILIIWRLTKHIGDLAAQKGLKKLVYQVMALLLWLCGEVFGLIVGYAILGDDESLWLIYLVALLSAGAGAVIAFLIMRFLPGQDQFYSSYNVEAPPEISPMRKFGRSAWVPALVILLALACACIGFGVSSLVYTTSKGEQVQVTNPVIGTELDKDGYISQPATEIPSETDVIYLGFYVEAPANESFPANCAWYLNGQPVYSSREELKTGQIVTALDSKQLGVSEFSKGNYQVIVALGMKVLTSASFTVK